MVVEAYLTVVKPRLVVVNAHLVVMKPSGQQSKSRGGAPESNKSQDDVDKVASRQLSLEREGEQRCRSPWRERSDEGRRGLCQAVDGA